MINDNLGSICHLGTFQEIRVFVVIAQVRIPADYREMIIT